MKSILISIKPEWVALILNGNKTIEIRKTMPKCKLPIKCYIYCTKDEKHLVAPFEFVEGWFYKEYNDNTSYACGCTSRMGETINGKVVAEFTLNTIEKYGWMHSPLLFIDGYMKVSENNLPEKELNYNACCITKKEIADYADDGEILPAPVFAWHINDLKIYNEPKELSDFGLKRPPQSWCYIEEE